MERINRRAVLDAEHRITLTEAPLPVPGPGEALVRVEANGICGSDIHFYEVGRLGNFVVTDPYVPGHEACGTVADVGEGSSSVAAGDRVVIEPGIPCGHCRSCRRGRYNLCPEVVFLSEPSTDGTFCDYLTVRIDALHPMPVDMTFEQGALVEPTAVAVHAVNRVGVRNGETGLVLGCGPIGLLTLQAFRTAGGAGCICVDGIERRRALALALGAAEALAPEELAGRDDLADVVFETAGSVTATREAFRLARPGGRVVQVGWPEENVVPLDVATFLTKELDYVSVNRYANAFPAAIAWLADGRVRAEPLITHRFELAEVAEAFRFTAENRGEVIKAIVVSEPSEKLKGAQAE